MMQQEGDDVVGSEQRARHRRLELVGHPARGMRIELGGGVDEAARPAAPIDESLNETDRQQAKRRDAQASALLRWAAAEVGAATVRSNVSMTMMILLS